MILKQMGMMALVAGVAGAELSPLPADSRKWYGDPVLWNFRADGTCQTLTNGGGIAVYDPAPLSEDVTIEAEFTPHAAQSKGWNFAGVAIVDDAGHFWHLALAQTPARQGCKPFAELAEMRAGAWPAQGDLKAEYSGPGAGAWRFGEPCRLRLSMGKGCITGTITGPDGRQILRKRYAFSAAAVKRGRPALRVSGMAGAFKDIRAGWGTAIAENTPEPTFPAFAMDNAVTGINDRATGFFSVTQKPDGRWWAIDPFGRGVVLRGVDHVTFNGPWCEKLGYCPHGRKNEKKYPGRAQWEEETLARLKAWGFNMLGAGCDPALKHRGLAHTVFLNIGSYLSTLGDAYNITPNESRPCSAFPNVFHPDFEAYCRYRARQMCAPNRNDPWLFGYFIDNELAWWGRGESSTGLFDAVMKKGAAHTAKIALKDFIAARCGHKIGWFNATFGTRLNGFDDLLSLQTLPHVTQAQRELKKDFLTFVADRYFSVTSRAIREADPNHLVLGARFAGTGGADPAVWEVSGKYCDVATFNVYPMADLDEGCVYTHFGKTREPVTDHFAKYYSHVKRPMLITEWSFPALDAGLPSMHGAGQRFRTQAERAEASGLFVRTMLALPFLLGYDYFMWVDEPALGISTPFPEDSNYGLINEDGVPYPLLTGMFAALQREAGAWRFKPAPQPRARPDSGKVPDAMAVARKTGTGGAKAFFAREGDTFRAGNGRIELTGRLGDGNMVRRVTLDGAEKPFGQYNALLQTLDGNGKNRWRDAHTVKAAEGRVIDGIAVVEVTGMTVSGQEGFEVTHRLLLPPGTPWFISEPVSVKNVGTVPLKLKSLFFRLYSDFRNTPALPRNLWGMEAADCWMDEADGRFFGAVAPEASGIRVDFWTDDADKSLHPDARLEVEEVTLLPNATYSPSGPNYLICVAGRGGKDAWMKTAQELKRLPE